MASAGMLARELDDAYESTTGGARVLNKAKIAYQPPAVKVHDTADVIFKWFQDQGQQSSEMAKSARDAVSGHNPANGLNSGRHLHDRNNKHRYRKLRGGKLSKTRKGWLKAQRKASLESKSRLQRAKHWVKEKIPFRRHFTETAKSGNALRKLQYTDDVAKNVEKIKALGKLKNKNVIEGLAKIKAAEAKRAAKIIPFARKSAKAAKGVSKLSKLGRIFGRIGGRFTGRVASHAGMATGGIVSATGVGLVAGGALAASLYACNYKSSKEAAAEKRQLALDRRAAGDINGAYRAEIGAKLEDWSRIPVLGIVPFIGATGLDLYDSGAFGLAKDVGKQAINKVAEAAKKVYNQPLRKTVNDGLEGVGAAYNFVKKNYKPILATAALTAGTVAQYTYGIGKSVLSSTYEGAKDLASDVKNWAFDNKETPKLDKVTGAIGGAFSWAYNKVSNAVDRIAGTDTVQSAKDLGNRMVDRLKKETRMPGKTVSLSEYAKKKAMDKVSQRIMPQQGAFTAAPDKPAGPQIDRAAAS